MDHCTRSNVQLSSVANCVVTYTLYFASWRPTIGPEHTQLMRNLPNFTNPPLDELVLSIQFASIEKMKTAHIGMFWEKIEHRFPHVSEQPPIGPAFETFGG